MKLEAKFERLGVVVTLPIECNREAYYGEDYEIVIGRIARALSMHHLADDIVEENDE